MERIYKEYKGITKKALKEINFGAVDILVKILKDSVIYGSTTQSGFIIGNRTTTCFQELPLEAVKKNIDIEEKVFTRSKTAKVR
ncbi:hypothetical protein [Viridibacillus arvi]|uniref:hypothetical protein n=1 Tax=Viridibacillus arvi TaxID=263475 RepID=UPI003D01D2DE